MNGLTRDELATMIALLSQGSTVKTAARCTHVHTNTLKYRMKIAKEMLGLSDVATISDMVAAGITQGWVADRRVNGRREQTCLMDYLEDGLPAGPVGVGIRTYLEARFATWRPELLAAERAA